MSAYARVNRGGHFLDFDNGIRGSHHGKHGADAGDPQLRGRASNSRTTCCTPTSARTSATSAACSTSRPTAPARRSATSSSTAPSRRASTSSARITPGENFRFQVVANYLDGEYTDYDACFPYIERGHRQRLRAHRGSAAAAPAQAALHAHAQLRAPDGDGEVEAFVTYTHVGDHTQDQSGLQQLGSYETWDVGITANFGDNWQFALRGTNLSRRARPYRKQLTHLWRGRGCRWCPAGAASRRPRDQFPGEVSSGWQAEVTPCSRAERRWIHPHRRPAGRRARCGTGRQRTTRTRAPRYAAPASRR